MEKLKIFTAGDFHGDRSIAQKLAADAVTHDADLILLNGDIVDEHQTEGAVGPFMATKKKVFLVPGNHDSIATDFLSERYNAPNLHGRYVIYNDIGIIGCSAVNCGLNQLSEDEIYDMLKASVTKMKSTKKTVFLSHVHPAGSKMEKFSHFVQGSTGLRRAIDAFQPDLVICGHVHEAEGIEEKIGKTTVVNVGKSGRLLEF